MHDLLDNLEILGDLEKPAQSFTHSQQSISTFWVVSFAHGLELAMVDHSSRFIDFQVHGRSLRSGVRVCLDSGVDQFHGIIPLGVHFHNLHVRSYRRSGVIVGVYIGRGSVDIHGIARIAV